LDQARRQVKAKGYWMSAGYIYQTKRTSRVKLVFWNGADVGLLKKPIENAEAQWRAVDEEDIQLSTAQLSALFEDLDWRRIRRLVVGSRSERRAKGQNGPSQPRSRNNGLR
jgi:transposase